MSSKYAGEQREKIVDAAVAVITEQGLQNLSLSEIETKAKMSRGQLTYHFPPQEDILLAVCDRLVMLIHQRVGTPPGQNCEEANAWDWIKHLLEKLITEPPVAPEFGCLQYTFLSQIGHREDFRRRLATLYEQWRNNMASGFAGDMAARRIARRVPPRGMATLVQAILHGLARQRTADRDAFDADEVLELCLDVLGTYLSYRPQARRKSKPAARKNSAPVVRARRLVSRTANKGVNGERI